MAQGGGHDPGLYDTLADRRTTLAARRCRSSHSPATCLADLRPSAAQQGTLFLWSNGDPGAIITDRPDFTEASVTVGCGVAQLESGYAYVFDDDGTTSVRTHTAPEALLRVGIFADWFEVRLAYTYIEETTSETAVGRSTINGSDDLYLGVKLALTGQSGILPEMAVVPQMRVPTGSNEVTAGETLSGVNWLYGWDVTDFIATGGSTQVNRRLDDVTDEPHPGVCPILDDQLFARRSDGRLHGVVLRRTDGADTNHNENYFDGGLTLLITDNVQLDVRAGVGLNSAAADMFSGIGLSIRM